jgi:hypothetical protein
MTELLDAIKKQGSSFERAQGVVKDAYVSAGTKEELRTALKDPVADNKAVIMTGRARKDLVGRAPRKFF